MHLYRSLPGKPPPSRPWRLAIRIPKYPPFTLVITTPATYLPTTTLMALMAKKKGGGDLEEDGGGSREDLGCGACGGVVWGADQCGGGHSK